MLKIIVIFFLTLLITNCSSFNVNSTKEYHCSVSGFQGAFIGWNGRYSSLEEAEKDGEMLRLRLVEKNMIDSNTSVICAIR